MPTTFSISTSMRFGLLGAILSVAAMYASAAGAAPLITLGHYIEGKSASCNSSVSSCTVTFTAVPAGKVLLVQEASCRISGPSTGKLRSLYLSGNTRNTYLVIGGTSNAGSYNLYQINNQVLAPYISGTSPYIQVSFSENGVIGLQCTISGQLEP